MKVRVAYLKRRDYGTVLNDGIELAASFENLDYLPRIGECVLLPKPMLDIIGKSFARRFEVVQIDHHWDKLFNPSITVYVADMVLPPIAADGKQ